MTSLLPQMRCLIFFSPRSPKLGQAAPAVCLSAVPEQGFMKTYNGFPWSKGSPCDDAQGPRFPSSAIRVPDKASYTQPGFLGPPGEKKPESCVTQETQVCMSLKMSPS